MESLARYPESPKDRIEKSAEVAKTRLDAMTPEQKKLVAERIQADTHLAIALDEIRSVSGALWDGWQKGVNGAVNGVGVVLKGTGTWIGETAASVIHDPE